MGLGPMNQGSNPCAGTSNRISCRAYKPPKLEKRVQLLHPVLMNKDTIRDWELSYYVRATSEEAEKIYDAIQTILCNCDGVESERECRVPVSGMHPVWSEFSQIDEETGDKTRIK